MRTRSMTVSADYPEHDLRLANVNAAFLVGGTAQDLHDWMVQVGATVRTLKQYGDPESVAMLEDLQDKAKQLDVELHTPRYVD